MSQLQSLIVVASSRMEPAGFHAIPEDFGAPKFLAWRGSLNEPQIRNPPNQ
jgi:hypothetical protein